MDLITWLRDRDGIGHRDDAADAGFVPSHVRAATWDHIERTLAEATSRGLHLAPGLRRRA